MTTETAEALPAAALEEPDFKLIAVGLIQESKSNPRKTFSAKGIEELAESIRQQGVLEPILVRPVEGKDAPYELVAGARRLRAARKAGTKEVPCLVRPLTDTQALEIMVIENLQREDLHPLEEAQGFRALMKEAGYKAQQISEKTGKSVSEIYATLKLLDLIEPARQAFLDGKIEEGHAVQIARLCDGDQKRALNEVVLEDGWREDKKSYLMTVRDLAKWIQREIHLDLTSVPWDVTDATLVPKAGPCEACPKKVGNMKLLFPDSDKPEACTDGVCFKLKGKAFLERRRRELEEKGEKVKLVIETYHDPDAPKGCLQGSAYRKLEAGAEPCEKTCVGLIAGGASVGKSMKICVAGPGNCRKPGHGSVSMPTRGKKRGGASKASDVDREAARQAEKEREKRIIKERATTRARAAIYEKVINATTIITRHDLELLAVTSQGAYMDDDPAWMPPNLASPADAAKASDKDLAKFLVAAALNDELGHYGDAKDLYRTAARHGVDVKSIEKDAVRQVTLERLHHERRQAWKGRAAAGKSSYDLLTCVGCGRTEKDQAKGGWHWVKKNDKTKTAVCNDCEREENERS